MAQTLTRKEEFHLIVLVMIDRLEVPLKLAILLGIHLISSRCTISTMLSIPPCSANRCNIMINNILLKFMIAEHMAVSGNENNLMPAYDVKHLRCVDNLLICYQLPSLTHRRMLADIKV